MVRELLAKAISQKKGRKCGADTLLKMTDKAVSGGPKNLSTNDDYLYHL